MNTYDIFIASVYVFQELPGGYGRVKPDIVTYGSSVRGSALQYVFHKCWVLFFIVD